MMASKIYEFSAKTITGKQIYFKDFKGLPVLITNFASNCGLCTSSLKSFSLLKTEFPDLQVLLFPSNDFNQEAGDYEKIKEKVFSINKNFIIFELTVVSGKNISPLFDYLINNSPWVLGKFVKWNFTKWIIDRKGNIKKQISPIGKVTENDIKEVY
ncbi:putative phospholipid hydroperoxide glutathione peroxidase [Cucumispora dikerogammari]|nr:putative phospholipid hydroperoxide glutathione peroxidase [Cucumispora dikerogammari]